MTEKTVPIDYIGSGDVATILGISRRTVTSYAKAGKIPARKLPSGMYRYVRGEIEAVAENLENDFPKKETEEAVE